MTMPKKTKLLAGTIENTIPSEIEAAARRRFKDDSWDLTGCEWDWTMASEEVKNVYRLRILISRYRAASTEGGTSNVQGRV